MLRTAVRSIRFLSDALVDALYPPHCVLSGEPLASRTHISQRALDACDPAPSATELLLTLQRHTEEDDTFLTSLRALYAVGSENGIDKAIYAVKYQGRVSIATILGRHLGEFLGDDFKSFDAIVPVPIHKARLRERGYNQSLFIANGMNEVMGVPVLEAVRRSSYTTSQTTLSDAERQHNVSGVFARDTSIDVSGMTLLLIDDVITTGATLNSCAEVLLLEGAKRVDAAAIGATV